MNNNRLERWLQKIDSTQDEEISCSECFDLLSHFVEVELSGADAAGQLPALVQHLSQCPTCNQEYETLRDFQRLENDGKLPSKDDLLGLIR